MFPDSRIAANFSLSHTSASYIIKERDLHHISCEIINDLVKSGIPFSEHFDETMTTQMKKANGHHTKIVHFKHEEVWTVFYTSLFFVHPEGDQITTKMYSKLLDDKIPVKDGKVGLS